MHTTPYSNEKMFRFFISTKTEDRKSNEKKRTYIAPNYGLSSQISRFQVNMKFLLETYSIYLIRMGLMFFKVPEM